jgi:hypothetical protein
MSNAYTQIHIQAVFTVQNRVCIIRNKWRERLCKNGVDPRSRPDGTRTPVESFSTDILPYGVKRNNGSFFWFIRLLRTCPPERRFFKVYPKYSSPQLLAPQRLTTQNSKFPKNFLAIGPPLLL